MSNYVITQADIRNTQQYQEYGVMPGDEISPDGTLVRKFSEDQEPVEVGEELTAEDIVANEWMLESDVQPGDRYVEGKGIYRDKSGSSFEQFKYHFDKSNGLTGYLKDLGTIYTGYDFWLSTGDKTWNPEKSSKAKYGENFFEASPEERRDMIYRARERELVREYGNTFDPDPDSFAATAGTIAGEIADPTSLIPIGRGVRGATLGGGILGGTYSAAEDLSKLKPVDPGKMAVTAGASALGAGALTFGGQKIAQAVTGRSARKSIDKVQEVVNRELASPWGTVNAENIPRLAAEAGVSERKLLNSLGRTQLTPEDLVERAVPEFSATQAVTKDSALSRLKSGAVDKYLGVLHTNLKNVAPMVAARLRLYEFDVMKNTQAYISRVRPFQEEIKALGNSPIKGEIARELANADTRGFARAEALMERVSPTMVKNFQEARKVLDEIKEELKIEGLDNYFPRLVKDPEGLTTALGANKPKYSGPFTSAQAAYAKEKGISVDAIPLSVKDAINNAVIRGRAPSFDTPAPRFLKARSVDVDNNLAPFYADPEVALENYIRGATNHVQRSKFFGTPVGKRPIMVTKEDGGIDFKETIGNFVERDISLRKLSADEQQKVQDLLTARFVDGETSMGKLASTIKEAGYIYTIANPTSALVQLGDIPINAALKGTWNTFTSMILPKRVKLTQVIEDQISKEFNDPGRFAKLLEFTFKKSGFKAVDRLSKETAINTAYKFNRKLVRTAKGEKEFRDKWANTFPDNMNTIVDDLKNNRVTRDIEFLLFNELSDLQPVSLSELPAGANDPKKRLLYMLKSFTIKQIDVVRRNVVQEYKKGNKVKAAMTAFRLGTFLSLSGLGVNQVRMLMRGEELLEAEELPTEALWSLLGVYGLSKYTASKYISQGEIGQAVGSTLMPPLVLLDNIAKGAVELTDEDSEQMKILKNIPVYGDLMYMWFGGGAEKAIERRERERMAE